MNIQEFRLPRQKMIIGAGLGLAATVLAACSSYGKKSDATGEASTSAAQTPGSSAGAAPAKGIAKTSQVPVGSGIILGEVVLTQPSAGVFKGFSSTCTHKGCTVDKVANGTIDCPCHGSKYDGNGNVLNGPATRALAKLKVTVTGSELIVT